VRENSDGLGISITAGIACKSAVSDVNATHLKIVVSPVRVRVSPSQEVRANGALLVATSLYDPSGYAPRAVVKSQTKSQWTTACRSVPVSRRGERVGKVTSACHSPRLDKNVGYAMVPIELAELGTELEVDVAGDRRDAVVMAMPFIDPKKEIHKRRLATER
jgi:glycine cleavage system aminomethyltransferase T